MKPAGLLEDSISRFRFSQSCLGLAGCLCVLYSVATPFWLKDGGLWAEWNATDSGEMSERDGFNGESLFPSHVVLLAIAKVTQGVCVCVRVRVCVYFQALLKGDLFQLCSLLMGEGVSAGAGGGGDGGGRDGGGGCRGEGTCQLENAGWPVNSSEFVNMFEPVADRLPPSHKHTLDRVETPYCCYLTL